VWWFEGGCDITLNNLTIVGPNTSGVVGSENDSGIQLSGVQAAQIEASSISDVDGDFVTVTGLHEAADISGTSIAAFPSTNVTVKGNTFSRSGRQGVTPQYVNGMTISNNTFSGVAATNIDLEADTDGGCACNVAVAHNTFSGPVGYLVAGLTGLSIQNFSFTHNTLVNGAQMKIQLAPQLASSNIDISDNAGDAGSTWPWPSIGIAYSVNGDSTGTIAGVTVSGNSFPAPANGLPFVRAGRQATQVTVSSNVLSGPSATPALLNEGTTSNRSCGDSAGPGLPLDQAC
jgi:parallel beta-helix repeat protein